ncbi:hypothetical protein RSSM_02941 [Rhodopirellula sallentina SM41]|uniref:Uncharacterized protein n=1 Tax=Rhodopirellula sallentina SM41 TaxID=1263870 RepID=M5UCR6_9BACT|nr:hypothetical protein RSSM_02941 [Rhodopirellula sallentina SM41]
MGPGKVRIVRDDLLEMICSGGSQRESDRRASATFRACLKTHPPNGGSRGSKEKTGVRRNVDSKRTKLERNEARHNRSERPPANRLT